MTGSRSWHGLTASLLPGSPTSLPPRSSSCSPPCAREQQLPTWWGGQRAEVGGLFGKTTNALRPALSQTRLDPTSCLPGAATNELVLAGPGFSLPCAPPSRGPQETGRWLMPCSARTLAGSHLTPRKGQFLAPLHTHPTLPTPCFPGHLRQVPRSGASVSCPGLPAASV